MVGLRSRLKWENALLLKPGVARNISPMRWTIQKNFQCSLVFVYTRADSHVLNNYAAPWNTSAFSFRSFSVLSQ